MISRFKAYYARPRHELAGHFCELAAAGFDIVKQSGQQQPAPQPADGQQGQGSAADELPFKGGGDGGKRQEAERTGGSQPTATVQQAIICPHCKRAIAITVNGI